MKKPWNPRRPRTPPSKTPSSFLPPFSPSVPSSSPTSPYISWDTLISRIQRLHATRLAIQRARGTLFRQYLCPIVISLPQNFLKRAVPYKNKKKKFYPRKLDSFVPSTILHFQLVKISPLKN